MKILITGAAGYIGRHVLKYLLSISDHELIAIDKIDKRIHPLPDILQFDLGDLPALEKLIQIERPDAVVHLAALVNPTDSIADPLAYYATNVANTVNLVRICLQEGVKHLVFISSSAVYGMQEYGAIKEDKPTRPVNPYSQSKVMCEKILEDASQAEKTFTYASLRVFSAVGEDRALESTSPHKYNETVIQIAAQTALGKRDRMFLYGDNFNTPDGTCVRDFVYIDDVSRMVSKSLDYLAGDNHSQVFNCGSGQASSMKEIVSAMKTVSKVDFQVGILQPRANEYPSLIADISRAEKFLDWSPEKHSLESLCRRSLELETGQLNIGT